MIDSKHIGQGVIDGVECEHLAFRNAEVDWQIWIQLGARPIPRKYVITSKMVAGGPQYTLRIKDWKTDAPAAADAFVFKNPAGMTKVRFRPFAISTKSHTAWKQEQKNDTSHNPTFIHSGGGDHRRRMSFHQ